MNGGWGISSEIALRWMPLDLIDDKSALVQVMAWCRQATSHYLSQCWPRSMSPNGITRPQRLKVNSLAPGRSSSSYESVISKHILPIDFVSASWEMALMWMPQITFNDKSTLVQVITLYCQATNHYLHQCWLRSSTPHGVHHRAAMS